MWKYISLNSQILQICFHSLELMMSLFSFYVCWEYCSCNNVALPYFTIGYLPGEGYNSVGSLMSSKNILMHYLVFHMILRLFLHLSIRVVCFTNTFVWVISRTSNLAIVNMAVQFKRK